MEIAKAIHTLTGQEADEHARRREEISTSDGELCWARRASETT